MIYSQYRLSDTHTHSIVYIVTMRILRFYFIAVRLHLDLCVQCKDPERLTERVVLPPFEVEDFFPTGISEFKSNELLSFLFKNYFDSVKREEIFVFKGNYS